MMLRAALHRVLALDGLNFVLTNALPRRQMTRWMGRLSKMRHPLVRTPSIALWRLFCDVDLRDAQKTEFESLHDAFVRALHPGARPCDPDPAILCSPSDGVVVACGRLEGLNALQVKGRRYSIADLIGEAPAAERVCNGAYVTLRLTAGMYHRFHSPHDGVVTRVCYQPGDVWNVNPPALARVDRLYCRNERAAIHLQVGPKALPVILVPVAAILVASIRLHFVDLLLHLGYRGPKQVACQASLQKGEEMGWFEHGSTIVVLAPEGCSIDASLAEGSRVRAGQALMRLP